MSSKDALPVEGRLHGHGSHELFNNLVLTRDATFGQSFNTIWTAVNAIDPSVLREVDQQTATDSMQETTSQAAGTAAVESMVAAVPTAETRLETDPSIRIAGTAAMKGSIGTTTPSVTPNYVGVPMEVRTDTASKRQETPYPPLLESDEAELEAYFSMLESKDTPAITAATARRQVADSYGKAA